MLLKYIDKLLERSFQKEPDYQRLDGLESDVWAQIQQSKAAAPRAHVWAFPAWGGAHLRYASLALALVAGLMASQLSTVKAPSDTLGLEVFSMNAPYMISSTLSNPDWAPS
tara:strand:- start:20501 stop:20833 length:333 start_codon:yes stop_codon:yes gene_type:complete